MEGGNAATNRSEDNTPRATARVGHSPERRRFSILRTHIVELPQRAFKFLGNTEKKDV